MCGAVVQREEISLNGSWHTFWDEAADWREAPPLPGTPLSALPREEPGAGWEGIEDAMESLRVPGTWEQSRPGYRGVAWHWRPLVIPEEWRGRRVGLRFEGVRLCAEVYLDQVLVGYDPDGLTPFEIDLTDRVHAGEHYTLALRVTCPGEASVWGGGALRVLAGIDSLPATIGVASGAT